MTLLALKLKHLNHVFAIRCPQEMLKTSVCKYCISATRLNCYISVLDPTLYLVMLFILFARY